MKLKIINGDLFEQDPKYALVHCVAADIADEPRSGTMGIAKAMQEKTLFKDLISASGIQPVVGKCIVTENVFNLITKPKYFMKPTYKSMESSLHELVKIAKMNNVKHLAMPKIGCGLDKLEWEKVLILIDEAFEDTDFDILICDK